MRRTTDELRSTTRRRFQGLNPAKSVGWQAFTTVVQRIAQHLRDRVAWMEPSDIAARYHATGGWGFLDEKQP